MFIIDFRNTNVSEYRFSVIGNSNVDMVYFYSRFINYASDCSIYLKIRSNNEEYVDKIEIASEDISVVDGALLCKWVMGAVSTHCKRIALQLQFEKEGDIIAQTGIVNLTLADSIDVDGEIIPIYPQVLKQLQEQIDELKADSVASYTMSYENGTLTIVLYNKEGEAVVENQVAIDDKLPIYPVDADTKVNDLPLDCIYNGHLVHKVNGANNRVSISFYDTKGYYSDSGTIKNKLVSDILGNSSYFHPYILGVKVNNTELTPDADGKVNIDLSNYYTKDASVIPAIEDLDIGDSTHSWRDIYVSRYLIGTTFILTVDDTYKSLYNVHNLGEGSTQLEYIGFNQAGLINDTTFTLKTAPSDFAEYKGELFNGNNNQITLTFVGVNKIITNDEDNVIVSGNTITLNPFTTIEFSIVNGNMVAINFGA